MTGCTGVGGGIAAANSNVLVALVRLANDTGRDLVVLSFLERPSDRPQALPPECSYVAFGGNRLAFSAAVVGQGLRAHAIGFDHVTLALPILPFAALGAATVFIFAHGSESWRRVRWTSRLSFRAARLSLANSRYTLRRMKERLGRFRGVACPLGLPGHMATTSDVVDDQPLAFLTADGQTRVLGPRGLLLVGRMHPAEREKGHRQLLKVLPRVRTHHPNAELIFAGDGDDRPELMEMARKAGVGDAVFFTGFIPRETLSRLYHGCFAFVMPSLQEGFGLVYVEAMHAGKACVGCFDQGTEDVVVHGETGWLVRDPSDEDELLNAVLALLEDPERTRAFGAAGARRVNEMFLPEHHQARVYEALLPLVR